MVVKVMAPGRVCYKLTGRTTGERVTIVGGLEGNEVIVQLGENKLQKCNINHLFPTEEVVDVKEVSAKELEAVKKEIAVKEKKKEEGKAKEKEEGKKEEGKKEKRSLIGRIRGKGKKEEKKEEDKKK